jgi:acetyl-CoA carboxylase biotin carboxyl carrier protein
MNLESIRELIRLMKENNIGEMDIESEGERVRLKTAEPVQTPVYAAPPPGVSAPTPAPAGTPEAVPEAPEQVPAKEEFAGVVIKSPIVGLFYRTPAPDKPPFVEIGDEIEEITVLCIIEAMKVMNEIKAETRGVLREILVESGQPVEFGQPLFLIDPAG